MANNHDVPSNYEILSKAHKAIKENGNCFVKKIEPQDFVFEKRREINIIVDIDGCILDSTEANKHLPTDWNDRSQWDESHKHIHKCVPNKWIQELIAKYNPDRIFYITSREDRGGVRGITLDALEKIDLFVDDVDMLLMRPNNCFESSADVKKALYKEHIEGKYDIEFAIDDSLENIEMWHSLGINTLQCRNGVKNK